MRKRLAKGSKLFCEGDRDCGVFVVLDGRVRVVQEGSLEGESRVLAVHGRGRFVGDLSMLTGQAVYVTAVAQTDVEVLEVPYDRLKEAVTQDQALGDLILRAFILRRNIHADLGAGLRIIGSRYSAETRRLRDFASRNRIPYRWEDVEEDPEAEVTLRAFDIPPDQTPVVIWKGQTVLRNPSNTELAELLGLRERRADPRGARPGRGRRRPGRSGRCGYAASEGLSTVVLDAIATGGQAATSSQIENYLGFPAGISAPSWPTAPWSRPASSAPPSRSPARRPSLDTGRRLLRGGAGRRGPPGSHTPCCVATGVRYRRLDVPGMDRLEGSSVYYAATEFEARLCRQDPVTVVGGGNSAGPGGLFLARTAAGGQPRHPSRRPGQGHVPLPGRPRRAVATRSRSGATARCASSSGDEALDEVLVHDLAPTRRSASRRRPCSC